MKLNKAQLADLMKTYNAYWDSYIGGDIKKIERLMDQGYTQIGSAETEVFFSKKAAIKFMADTIDQVVGQIELRNREIKKEILEESVLFTDLSDIYVLTEGEWVFYAKFRASSLLQQEDGHWKFRHQHSSFPDIRTDKGDNIAIKKIAAENIELKDAIKRHTVQLEHKNRELEIEAALERVRSRSMAMHKSEELSDAAVLLYDELRGLGLTHYFNCGYVAVNESENKQYVWTSSFDGKRLEGHFIPLTGDSVFDERYEAWKQQVPVFHQTIGGKQLKKHIEFVSATLSPKFIEVVRSGFRDPSVFYCCNFGKGYLHIITDRLFNADEESLLDRFTKVFEQTYTRFLDLKKAEEQAREAQIEVALERIRARALAMHSSSELMEVANVMREQMGLLEQPELEASVIHLYDDNPNELESWFAMRPPGRKKGDIITGTARFSNSAITRESIKAHKSKETEYTLRYGGAKLKEWINSLKVQAPAIFNAFRGDFPQQAFYHYSDFSGGALLLVSHEEPSEEAKELQKRAAAVFDLAYRRYLDLQKAEAQVREAQIEAALERIRSRSMAMHDSNELTEVIACMFEEMRKLDFVVPACSLILYKENLSAQHWFAGFTDEVYPQSYTIPYIDTPYYTDLLVAWQNGSDYEEFVMEGKAKVDYAKWLLTKTEFKNLPKAFVEGSGMKTPTPLYFADAYMKYGTIEAIGNEPLTSDKIQILKRIAHVFEQTYTRFLDLQKAEAQAREAEIELALERVRAASMAMHKSEELQSIILLVYDQLGLIGIDMDAVQIEIYKEGSDNIHVWVANDSDPYGSELQIKDMGFKIVDDLVSARKSGKEEHAFSLDKKTKDRYYAKAYVDSDFKYLPDAKKELINDGDYLTFYEVFMEKTGLQLISFDRSEFKKEEKRILKRFAKVFDQFYIRFLDIQKAEEQAREAQIEAALERVRSKTMAMHNSKDLEDIVISLFEEVLNLGLDKSMRCGIGILEDHEGMETRSVNSNADGTVDLRVGMLNMSIHPMLVGLKKAWKKGEEGYSYYYTKKDVRKYYEALNNEPEYPFNADLETLPQQEFHQSFFFSSGILFAFSEAPISEESSHILARVAAVFGQTYRRFLDLQKAEAQAKEAQIESALERVRSKTMAMHNSDEVGETIVALFDEVLQLGIDNSIRCGIGILHGPESTHLEVWSATSSPDGEVDLKTGLVNIKIHPMIRGGFEAWKSGKSRFTYALIGKDNRTYYNALNSEPEYSFHVDLDTLPENNIVNNFNFSDGILFAFTENSISEEAAKVLGRFAGVFSQTYRRYLDLQKAEEQAREAQIEAAMERVRARSMAMHQSDELWDVINVVSNQFELLDIALDNCFINIFEEHSNDLNIWIAAEGQAYAEQVRVPFIKNAAITRIAQARKKGEKFYTQNLDKKTKDEFFNHFFKNAKNIKVPQKRKNLILKGLGFTGSVSLSAHASITISNYRGIPYTEQENNILKRIGVVFEQTYNRFLDLKRAEGQALEARIESALERVRSRSMAMQQSSELNMILAKVFEELTSLELEMERAVIWIYYPENRSVRWWAANPEAESGSESFFIANQNDPVYDEYWKAWEERRTKDLYILEGDYKENWTNILFNETELKKLPEIVKTGMAKPKRLYLYNTFNDFGVLFISCLEPLSDDKFTILERFGKVFNQSYTRFNDIKQAEIREKEAIKRSSLDRVRAEIASMRTTKDLERITPLIWKELKTLGVPFFRCGVFIVNEDEEMVHAYLSTPSGASLAALHLPFNDADIPFIPATVKHWKVQKPYKEEWSKKEFIETTKQFLRKGQIQDSRTYQAGEAPPQQLVLQLVPFKQGMLYAGSSDPLIEEHTDLMKDLADAFAVAYARYEDFKELEMAKARVDDTLLELKSTQSQLIQSEKMASLGELTAGIAHEIQNPLNFVNNFSEVSSELVDEMQEEIDAGNLDDVKDISGDLKQNLEKINEHGKRASGIVKGMLEHSRTGDGVKELTDINKLADEYLRLAFHGLRAKDKSFNANFKMEFDEVLPKINVVPQDMGRVLLNLINNAFYAVKEVEKPMVAVSTRTLDNKIEITVADNGQGIPEDIKDKIFQPFFTTKPTGSGTGLGLSMSYDIITKGHGGSLKVKSETGKGTIFEIQLPN